MIADEPPRMYVAAEASMNVATERANVFFHPRLAIPAAYRVGKRLWLGGAFFYEPGGEFHESCQYAGSCPKGVYGVAALAEWRPVHWYVEPWLRIEMTAAENDTSGGAEAMFGADALFGIDVHLDPIIIGPFVMATTNSGKHESTVGYGLRIGAAFTP